jgi:hypothetical protein
VGNLGAAAMSDFLIRCRVCDDAAGIHQWLTLPTAGTRGRWAAEHTTETGHDSWECYDGSIGQYTHWLHRRLTRTAEANRELYNELFRRHLAELEDL